MADRRTQKAAEVQAAAEALRSIIPKAVNTEVNIARKRVKGINKQIEIGNAMKEALEDMVTELEDIATKLKKDTTNNSDTIISEANQLIKETYENVEKIKREHKTRYIVTVKGSQRNGFTSHIERVLPPNSTEYASNAINKQIQAQINAQIQAQLQAQLHPEKTPILIRYIVTIKGLPSSGYTTEIEKIIPKEELQRQRAVVIDAIKEADNTAVIAKEYIESFFHKIQNNRTEITPEIRVLCYKIAVAANNAVIAAEKVASAVKNAEEAIHPNKLFTMNGHMMTITAIVDVAIDMSNQIKGPMDSAVNAIVKIQEVDPNVRNAVISARKVATGEDMTTIWNTIYEIIMNPPSNGGYQRYRNHTYRNHKQRKQCKHYTARKS